jgi:hypothetical protein
MQSRVSGEMKSNEAVGKKVNYVKVHLLLYTGKPKECFKAHKK